MHIRYIVYALFLLAIGSGTFMPADAVDLAAGAGCKPLVFAHRGGRKWAPENTLAAFRQSVQAHADGIELDIHKCKSGELVVIHDETLERTTNGAGYVKDKTLKELKQLDAGSWYAARFKDERLPTLSEVLNAVDGKLTVNVEIKNTPVSYAGIDDELIKVLAAYKHPDKIMVSSFDHQILRQFHQKAPQYRVGFLDDAIPAEMATYGHLVGAYSWNPDYTSVRADAVKQAHNASLAVYAWTPNKADEWQKLADMGVDAIITDDPAGLLNWEKR